MPPQLESLEIFVSTTLERILHRMHRRVRHHLHSVSPKFYFFHVGRMIVVEFSLPQGPVRGRHPTFTIQFLVFDALPKGGVFVAPVHVEDVIFVN